MAHPGILTTNYALRTTYCSYYVPRTTYLSSHGSSSARQQHPNPNPNPNMAVQAGQGQVPSNLRGATRGA